ncbi:MAG TPA: DoxX family protein [Taishania sp.]|nr:DoxX family protein [Taishania sp.]
MDLIKKLLKNPSYGTGADFALLLIRIAAGGFMAFGHGWPKLMKIMNGDMQFLDPIGLGPELSLILVFFAEFICGLLILIGLVPRLAAIVLVINMIVILFVVHISDPFADKELSYFYFVGYLAVLLAGAGKHSVQYMLSKNK